LKNHTTLNLDTKLVPIMEEKKGAISHYGATIKGSRDRWEEIKHSLKRVDPHTTKKMKVSLFRAQL